nr:5-methyltetrahydropteroyltriglutamate--homocysteine S-methyltransferase [Zavarzinia compransoris]
MAVATLGFPRIGPRRELKTALEAFWAGRMDEAALLATAADLRFANWLRQRQNGATVIPSNDFSLYDHVLDTAVMLGAVPPGFDWGEGPVPLSTYFALARGDKDRPALEMTKWFDTNYHYMVPELGPRQDFRLADDKPLREFIEARDAGIHTRPVLLGPVSFLLLAKMRDGGDPLALLHRVVPVYVELLQRLKAAGADWVQIDEPALVLDLDPAVLAAFGKAYPVLAQAAPGLRLLLAGYFGGYGDNLDLVLRLPVAGLHFDLLRGGHEINEVMRRQPTGKLYQLGVIDGRNVWRADLAALLDRLEPVVARLGRDRVILAPSCSLLHVPVDLALETGLDPDLRRWLAFATQKIGELAILARGLGQGRGAVRAEVASAADALEARRISARIHDPKVARRLARVTAADARRAHGFETRRDAQKKRLNLPDFPTTTIGSFPQTAEVRQARAAHARGELSAADYDTFLKAATAEAIRWQEEIGIDVPVHGEFERNDMVQYFGEQLAGFAFTRTGWVQSYGSRCVRPPVIYGDVSRPRPMTVEWARYAQSLTEKPMKGMLTGPVTMLQWSFVRDDLPRADVCRQIALALRDEVDDLEAAGIAIIQIDEPAIREGLPLRRRERADYLAWAVECFRLASSGVRDETQIHTHMCYSEFNDIIQSIAAMDADVISIETARSKMELLAAFADWRYPNEIGPGVYDIHAPRCPDVAEMTDLLKTAATRLEPGQIWVNPDCGLKTRKWDEVRPALANMVEAARRLRRAM